MESYPYYSHDGMRKLRTVVFGLVGFHFCNGFAFEEVTFEKRRLLRGSGR